jgi:hypothetical protein
MFSDSVTVGHSPHHIDIIMIIATDCVLADGCCGRAGRSGCVNLTACGAPYGSIVERFIYHHDLTVWTTGSPVPRLQTASLPEAEPSQLWY